MRPGRFFVGSTLTAERTFLWVAWCQPTGARAKTLRGRDLLKWTLRKSGLGNASERVRGRSGNASLATLGRFALRGRLHVKSVQDIMPHGRNFEALDHVSSSVGAEIDRDPASDLRRRAR